MQTSSRLEKRKVWHNASLFFGTADATCPTVIKSAIRHFYTSKYTTSTPLELDPVADDVGAGGRMPRTSGGRYYHQQAAGILGWGESKEGEELGRIENR